MNCETVERDLDAYVDRELGSDPAAAIREHLTSCPACRRRVADRKGLSRLIGVGAVLRRTGPIARKCVKTSGTPDDRPESARVGSRGRIGLCRWAAASPWSALRQRVQTQPSMKSSTTMCVL